MAYKVIFQKEALDKIQDAFDWYEGQKLGLGYELIEEIEICNDYLSINPQQYSFINDLYRRVKTNRFPYLLVYEIEEKTVIVLNFRHVKQKPL